MAASRPVTCVVLTVALVQLHQHRGRDHQEVSQGWRHRVHHHREPLAQAAQALQRTAGHQGPQGRCPPLQTPSQSDFQGPPGHGAQRQKGGGWESLHPKARFTVKVCPFLLEET